MSDFSPVGTFKLVIGLAVILNRITLLVQQVNAVLLNQYNNVNTSPYTDRSQ